jgi:hypothetical protein
MENNGCKKSTLESRLFCYVPEIAKVAVTEGKSEVDTELCKGTGGGGPRSTWTKVKPGVSVALRLAFK